MFYTDDELIELFATSANPRELFARLSAAGTPLVHPTRPLMTFIVDTDTLGAALPEEPVREVHLWINRLTDKAHHEHGVMRQVPGTSVWVRTVYVPPTVRAAYCFRLNAGGHRPPGHNQFPHARDPFARGGTVVDAGSCGLSLLLGARQSPSTQWARLDRHRPASYRTFTEGGKQYFWWAPAAAFQDLPLLILADADVWFTRQRLDLVLGQAIATGKLPPVAVIGRGFASAADRKESLGLNSQFQAELTSGLAGLARREAKNSGHQLSDLPPIIAGQSLGAFNALIAAMDSPQAFSSVITYSPSLWWSPAPGASPRDLHTQITPWLVERLYAKSAADFPDFPIVYLAAGLREDQLLPHCLNLAFALEDCGWPHTYQTVDGGHDIAWWRELLLSHLAAALKGLPPAALNPNCF
ncbi:hypothetical protein CPHO_11130 [Corynebacterium phocae]|uniref:Enterochelin esterase N-terminal domain-containing protein n=2 Tax=Corynebacterium phocae TaxID=161895 RepID=A0A1L7D6X4_9CORY|nr:alpha/beta hydrolase-fold protein [Corynebacterium phocae]APT93801.1 hypothetical protein CPHO_11130 [Corynebacterium phocae]